MSTSPWTKTLAVVALALPLLGTGCSSPCDDLEEICGNCPPTLNGNCMSAKNNCSVPGIAGPVGGDVEDTCCENAIDVYEPQCGG